jgi:hypothetical protein
MKINTIIYLILAERTQLDCSGAPPPLYFRCIFSGGPSHPGLKNGRARRERAAARGRIFKIARGLRAKALKQLVGGRSPARLSRGLSGERARAFTSHLRLVAKIAMGYRGYGLPISEVISEGNVGLMQAD